MTRTPVTVDEMPSALIEELAAALARAVVASIRRDQAKPASGSDRTAA